MVAQNTIPKAGKYTVSNAPSRYIIGTNSGKSTVKYTEVNVQPADAEGKLFTVTSSSEFSFKGRMFKSKACAVCYRQPNGEYKGDFGAKSTLGSASNHKGTVTLKRRPGTNVLLYALTLSSIMDQTYNKVPAAVASVGVLTYAQ